MTTGYKQRGRHSWRKRLGCLALAFLSFTTFSRAQETLTNCSEAGLRAALETGGTFLLACDEPITITQTLLVTRDTTLRSATNLVTIQADPDSTNGIRLFRVSPGVRLTLINLNLTGGRSTAGAAIYNDRGLVSLQNCVISSNQVAGVAGANGRRGGNSSYQTGGKGRSGAAGISAAGGAIYNRLGTVNVNVCVFRSNLAEAGDGGRGGAGGNGYAGGGDGGSGGAGGPARGGAIFNERGSITVSNSAFYFNRVTAGSAGTGGTNGIGPGTSAAGHGGRGGTGAGGAIYNTARTRSSINGVTFLDNAAISGDSAKAGATRGPARNGPSGADALGGAICNYGVNECVNSTFLGNRAKAGAGGDGGDSTITGGKGGRGGYAWGGGIFNSGRAYAWNCTFSDGFAAGGNNSFGGIGGFADGRGGSIGSTHGAHLANGAGVFRLANTLLVNPLGATATYITNTLTVISNAVGTTSAVAFVCVTNIVRSQGLTTFSTNCSAAPFPTNGVNLVNGQFLRFQTNTVSAVRTIGFGGFKDLGGNLATDRSIKLITKNRFSIITNDAGLQAQLELDGGLAPTLALQPGSPAIDAGRSTNCPATDQRGVARPEGEHCDIGAFEFQAGAGPPEILTAPSTNYVQRGVSESFNLTVRGALPLTFQWFRNETIIPGATQATLTIASVGYTDAGAYTLAVSNLLGGALGGPITLKVLANDLTTVIRGDTRVLRWSGQNGIDFTPQYRDAFDEQWLDIASPDVPLHGTGAAIEFADPDPDALIATTREYRVLGKPAAP